MSFIISETGGINTIPQSLTTPYLSQSPTTPYLSQSLTTPYLSQSLTTPYLSQSLTTPYLSQSLTTPYLSQSLTTRYLSQSLTTPYLSQSLTTPYLSQSHCAKNVVYASVYFCVYFAYTINIPRVVYISKIQLVYFKNPQVTIIHCVYSRSIKNTQTTMNYANLDNFRKNRYEFRY